MLSLESQALPLRTDAEGVVRVAGTRVTLDTLVAAFKQGATAEQIADDYPVVDLSDIYAVITYYLRHREDVDQYLAEQRREGERVRLQMRERIDPHGVRDRLLARRAHREGRNGPASGG